MDPRDFFKMVLGEIFTSFKIVHWHWRQFRCQVFPFCRYWFWFLCTSDTTKSFRMWKELDCPCEQGGRITGACLPAVWSLSGASLTKSRERLFSIYYHAHPQDELKGAIFTKKIQLKLTWEHCNIIYGTNSFYLPAARTITQVPTYMHNEELLKGSKSELSWIVC